MEKNLWRHLCEPTVSSRDDLEDSFRLLIMRIYATYMGGLMTFNAGPSDEHRLYVSFTSILGWCTYLGSYDEYETGRKVKLLS